MIERQAAAYDFRFDIRDRANIDNSPLLAERRHAHVRYVRRQMESLLGEKFHVLINTTRYNIIDGKLYGEDMFVPALDSFKKGRDHRRLHGNSIDALREDAEIVGFAKIDPVMADRNTQEGHMMFFASPPGGTHTDDFYDIFVKMKDERGAYVEARRYSSGATLEEYGDFVGSLGGEVPDEVDAVYFLANPTPVKDPRFKTPDDIHAYLHREHGYMTREEFEQRILEPTSPYLNLYANEPNLLHFKAAINRSDEVNEERRRGIVSIVDRNSRLLPYEVNRLGSKDIKEENLPCGNLSTAQSETTAFKVSRFERSYEYDKFGFCNECSGETGLGPCGICEPCDYKMRQKQKSQMAA